MLGADAVVSICMLGSGAVARVREFQGTDHPQPLRPSPKVGLAGVSKRRVGGEARRREHGRARSQQLENRRVTDTREAIRGHQRPSEAIRGNHRAIRGNHRAIRGKSYGK